MALMLILRNTLILLLHIYVACETLSSSLPEECISSAACIHVTKSCGLLQCGAKSEGPWCYAGSI